LKLVSSRKNRRSSDPLTRNITPIANNSPDRRPAPINNTTAPDRRPAPINNTAAPERRPAPQNNIPTPDRHPVPPGNGVYPNGRPVQNSNQAVSRSNVHQNAGINRHPNVQQRSNGNIKSGIAKKLKAKKSPLKPILITMMIILILSVSSFVALGFYVDSLDTIFPNVLADGINVSGMTLQEAIDHLVYIGYENNAEGISITLIFPDDTSFTVTGDEVGLSFNAQEAATAAFAFGRSETFFKNELTYIRSLFERTELTDLSSPVFNDSLVRSLAAEYTDQFNKTLFSGSITPNESYITLVRGTGLHPAIEEDVFNTAIQTLNRAISEHDALTVTYSPGVNSGDTLESQLIELQLLFDEIDYPPVSSYWNVETLSASASSYGRTFDLDKAKENLINAVYGEQVVVEIEVLPPDYSQEYFESLIFAHTLSTSETRELSGNSNRLSNIRLAAEKINGIVLNPGDEFSFNTTVGRRTREAGFLPANVIVNGIFEQGIGGGICQVSSTLHDAVLHTTLNVVERSPHGLRISYMPKDTFSSEENNPLGNRFANDAMVNWGTNDYRFSNNTDFPLRIEATVSGRNLKVELIGTKLDDNYIEIETVILSEFQSGEVEQQTDSLPMGERRVLEGSRGQLGYRVQTFKLIFSADGTLLSRDSITTRSYGAQNRIILVGIGPPAEEPVFNPGPGTGTGPGETDPGPGTGPGDLDPGTGTGGGETGGGEGLG